MTSKREEMLKALQDCPGELSGILAARPDLLEPLEAEPEPEVTYFDPEEWAREKQASRDKDAADIASGRKTLEQVRQENCMLPLDAKLNREKMPRL